MHQKSADYTRIFSVCTGKIRVLAADFLTVQYWCIHTMTAVPGPATAVGDQHESSTLDSTAVRNYRGLANAKAHFVPREKGPFKKPE